MSDSDRDAVNAGRADDASYATNKARMLCGTAGLNRGQVVTVINEDYPFLTVLDYLGNEHLVLVGDVEEVTA